jgi:hypothetical protein
MAGCDFMPAETTRPAQFDVFDYAATEFGMPQLNLD